MLAGDIIIRRNLWRGFIENWAGLPQGIARRITLENDDKIFTAMDTLYLCEKLMIPMVLDIHHSGAIMKMGVINNL